MAVGECEIRKVCEILRASSRQRRHSELIMIEERIKSAVRALQGCERIAMELNSKMA